MEKKYRKHDVVMVRGDLKPEDTEDWTFISEHVGQLVEIEYIDSDGTPCFKIEENSYIRLEDNMIQHRYSKAAIIDSEKIIRELQKELQEHKSAITHVLSELKSVKKEVAKHEKRFNIGREFFTARYE